MPSTRRATLIVVLSCLLLAGCKSGSLSGLSPSGSASVSAAAPSAGGAGGASRAIAVGAGPKCALTGGSWYSAYDDRYLDSSSQLDVDHLVPLAESWDSGASTWTAKEREAYANDLDDARALIAVSAASNRSKADKDPTEWLPPYAPYWCTYVTNWVADKMRYQLSVDPAEHNALTERLDACPDQPITVTYAR